jgi:dynein heavy chain
MCMSPIGDVFRARLRQFPALVNCCTIDWFSPWPDEALRSVAKTILNDIPNFDDPDTIEKVTNMCTFIHQSAVVGSAEFKDELARINYITPTAYLSLLEIFGAMINDKRKSLQDQRQKTAIGMDKLETTEKEVIILQAELEEMQPALKIAKRETEEAIVIIAANKKDAEVTAIAVGKEEAEANEKKDTTEAIAADAQRDLDEALPALDQAVASLKSLKVSDITELKAFKNPPAGVKMVMEGVCIMRGVKPKRINGEKPGEKIDDYWSVATPLLGNPKQFLDSLFGYDKENIPDSVIAKIKPYIDDPKFQPAEIKKSSEACTAICSWVRAMDKYHHVSKMVEPKRLALSEASASLEITMKALKVAMKKLADVNASIEAMEADLKAKTDKKKELEDKAEECAAKLIRAEKLIGGLGGEKVCRPASSPPRACSPTPTRAYAYAHASFSLWHLARNLRDPAPQSSGAMGRID